MDRLSAMALFLRVVERGSFSAAAREAGLSQPAVSMQVRQLEARLGTRLLNRSTRRLGLTAAGETFYERGRQLLAQASALEEEVAGSTPALAGRIRLHAPVGFGEAVVAPALIAFQAAHAEVITELVLDDRISDLVLDGVDLAIRLGPLDSQGLVARRIGEVRRALVAAPAYLARHGRPTTPEALARHRGVRFAWARGGDLLALSGPAGPVKVPIRPALLANNHLVQVSAIRAGLGIGTVQLPLVRDLLAAGELERVLPDHEPPPFPLHAILPSRSHVPQRVRALADHLQAALRAVLSPGD